jgi:hypothetical protein
MSSVKAVIWALNTTCEFTKGGLAMRHPYWIIVYPGPNFSQPVSWESWKLSEAVNQLEQFRNQYPTHWIDKDPRIVVESGRWDLVQSV